MNLAERTELIAMLCDNLKKHVTAQATKMPDDWNGIEIKVFIGEYYTTNFIDTSKLTGSRKKEYKNHCLINSLL